MLLPNAVSRTAMLHYPRKQQPPPILTRTTSTTLPQVFTDWGIPRERERPGLVAGAADVRAALEREQLKKGEQDSMVQLLDARAAAQFTGKSAAVDIVC